MKHTVKRTGQYAIIASLLCVFMLSSFSAHAIGLKENSVISGDTITLGDIFYDLPRDENRVLGAAPRPGKDMILNSRTLLRIAMALDLPWRPSGLSDNVTLRREATIIDYDQIKEALYTALYDEAVYGDYELSIPAQYQKIILPHEQPATMVITRFSADTKNKTFKATIAAPSAENPIQHFQIRGRINAVITVPVLADNLQSGRIITGQDIRHIKIKERDFTRDTIVDASTLIGMTARRVIIAGRPIRASDMIAPMLIERGEIVTLFLNIGSMALTTQAKALQSGSKGDIIRVVNTASNKTLQAIITGSNQVSILQH
ncbi:MAG: flagella basal body P-ring formation protein FlgA [Zetaproteobacteria bacterium]|nr:MAG: flagella basal body P-ring formation protein FlgA [Zetaproteobacteria bacterium]